MANEYILTTITSQDFHKICRTCLADDKLTPICDTFIDNFKTVDFLKENFLIEVEKDDSKPQNICETCLIDLYRLYEFKKRCQNTEALFKSLIPNIDIEENEEVRIHASAKAYQCEICGRGFNTSATLKAHKTTHSDKRSCVCSKCGMGFSRVDALHIHEKTHSNKEHTCNHCGHLLKRLGSLKRHLAKHKIPESEQVKIKCEIEKTVFECDICKHKVATKHGLKQHISNSHGEKSFLCGFCEKGFVTKRDMLAHSKVHTKEKPLTCTSCGKRFARLSGLNKHMRIHTGKRPYSCEICLNSFTQGAHLKRHVRLHTGERPYSCRFCAKTFRDKANLTSHLRTHTGERPYLCSICGSGFTELTAMKRHRRTHDLRTV